MIYKMYVYNVHTFSKFRNSRKKQPTNQPVGAPLQVEIFLHVYWCRQIIRKLPPPPFPLWSGYPFSLYMIATMQTTNILCLFFLTSC